MESKKLLNILIVLIFTIFVENSYLAVSGKNNILINTKGRSGDGEPFIPTKEWQVVKEGQQIPPGLHIRSNLQTGVTEAKLMDEKPEKGNGILPVLVNKKDEKGTKEISDPGHGGKPATTTTKLTKEQIMKALNTIASQDDVKDKQIANEAKSKKFRNYDELKKDFEKINMTVKTDVEMIKELMKKLNSTNSTVDEKVVSMTDLEYYLHQIDNAIDFMKMDGLNLLLEEMNSKEWKLRSEATFAIGSAMQSNVKVQIRALELGLLKVLKRQLFSEGETISLNRALYSLSTLLRNFPYAQLKFVQDDGLKAMSSLFLDKSRIKPRLQVRMVTLLHDLVTEHAVMENDKSRRDDMHRERLRQYKQVNMAHHMVQNGWCELTPQLLSLPDHDSREKVLISLNTFRKICPELTPKMRKDLLNRLKSLQQEYKGLAEEEKLEGDSNGFFNTLLLHVSTLIAKTANRSADEL